jgi:hypothetical protein
LVGVEIAKDFGLVESLKVEVAAEKNGLGKNNSAL